MVTFPLVGAFPRDLFDEGPGEFKGYGGVGHAANPVAAAIGARIMHPTPAIVLDGRVVLF